MDQRYRGGTPAFIVHCRPMFTLLILNPLPIPLDVGDEVGSAPAFRLHRSIVTRASRAPMAKARAPPTARRNETRTTSAVALPLVAFDSWATTRVMATFSRLISRWRWACSANGAKSAKSAIGPRCRLSGDSQCNPDPEVAVLLVGGMTRARKGHSLQRPQRSREGIPVLDLGSAHLLLGTGVPPSQVHFTAASD